eukprot:364234-Chlamydomonas_euryale.AAC.14
MFVPCIPRTLEVSSNSGCQGNLPLSGIISGLALLLVLLPVIFLAFSAAVSNGFAPPTSQELHIRIKRVLWHHASRAHVSTPALRLLAGAELSRVVTLHTHTPLVRLRRQRCDALVFARPLRPAVHQEEHAARLRPVKV